MRSKTVPMTGSFLRARRVVPGMGIAHPTRMGILLVPARAEGSESAAADEPRILRSGGICGPKDQHLNLMTSAAECGVRRLAAALLWPGWPGRLKRRGEPRSEDASGPQQARRGKARASSRTPYKAKKRLIAAVARPGFVLTNCNHGRSHFSNRNKIDVSGNGPSQTATSQLPVTATPSRRLFALFGFGSEVIVALTGIEPVFQP